MGNFLFSLGQATFKYRWRTLIAWVVILVILGAAAVHFIKPTSSAISIPGTEAQKTLDRYSALFPGNGQGSGRVVIAAPNGKTVDDYKYVIADLTDALAHVNGVQSATNPFTALTTIAKDRTIAYIPVSLTHASGSIDKQTFSDINTAVATARKSGLQVELGGDLINKNPGEILGIGEISGVLLALVVLVITFASLVAAGLPLLVAITAIGVSMAGLFSLSQVIDISSTTPTLAVMLGLAVGIDYSLFIVNRYKAFLLEGHTEFDAVGRSLATAGNAVIFAATTVVIALASLVIVQIPFITSMGLAAAATVAVAALVALTLLPALLGFAGTKLFVGKTRRLIRAAQQQGPHHTEHALHSTFWYKWGNLVTRRPALTLSIALVVLVTVALPIFSLKLGLPVDEYAAANSTQRNAYNLMAKGFGAGSNGPLLLVVEGLPATTNADRAALGPYAPYYQLRLVASAISKVAGVQQAFAVQTTDNGTKGVIQVVPSSGPSDQATIDLITYLRDPAHQKALTNNSSISIGVTGSTALQYDINQKLSGVLPEYLSIVVGLSLILLVIAFRSILVPIKATLGFLLSVAAMFGGLVAVFQWGWLGVAAAPGPIISFIPIIGIGILFGLAMDYEFFLVSGMHEAHAHTKDAHKAVMRGFSMGSKVVTAAGFIMISVFAGFISNSDATIQALGFALALGIFVDAFIVRLTIVPAVMTLLGNAAWWMPKWLQRILPHVSVEGTPKK